MSESVHSEEVDQSINQERLENKTDSEILELIEDLLNGNEILREENLMFEKYIKKVMTTHPKGNYSTGSGKSSPSANSLEKSALHGGSKRRRSKSSSKGTEIRVKLTSEQKCEIALREIEELRDDINKNVVASEKLLDSYKSLKEEAIQQITELKKFINEFDREIIRGAINARTKKIMAEKIVKFVEDKLRQRETFIKKLKLKNTSLRLQKKKLQVQLKQKEEMGEVLHEVDFNQLKIENKQYMDKIEQKNEELLKLKLLVGNTMQMLNSRKKQLNTLTDEYEQLQKDIDNRLDLLDRIEHEHKVVDMEQKKADEINKTLQQQLEDYKVPEVWQYVQEKAKLYNQKKNLQIWERKVEIAEMALKLNRKIFNQVNGGQLLESTSSHNQSLMP
ncbi:hypothetical protein SNEBB_000291 [Seison nebaliae]|nr:hypothetical protein SNEBB_000291 [Seison nebaliae]